MAPRASWKGFLTVGALSCGVGLHAAASTAERISLHMVSRKTGHRLRRQYVDEETGAPVEGDEQVKGYEVARGEFVTLEPEDVAAVVPQGTRTIAVDTFLPCGGIDTAYLDRPYFLAPVDAPSAQVLALLAAAMAERKVAALGEAVLFRRVRRLLIRPVGEGGALIASTLNFDYEVRPAGEAFADVPDAGISGEMLELATHIIRSKPGRFDPATLDDRYEAALAALVRARMEGKPLPKPEPRRAGKVVSLLDALRASAGAGASEAQARSGGKSSGEVKSSGKGKSSREAKSSGKGKSSGKAKFLGTARSSDQSSGTATGKVPAAASGRAEGGAGRRAGGGVRKAG
ncbi:Ku protein [Xanthobacter sp. V3C-3]|uniref:non-homologous end joining protein Ku n=1 Tax=Xanthobacter lutulentifluminis TaxID=3119935 RepID=UPI00372B02A8